MGGRRGGTYVGSERSITNEEYVRAVAKAKPIITFIKRDVQTAFQIFRRNPQANLSGLVDDARIFDFVEMVSNRSEDNWLRPFETVEDIKQAITAQFAYIALLYAHNLVAERSPKNHEATGGGQVVRFPGNLPRATHGDKLRVPDIAGSINRIRLTEKPIQRSSGHLMCWLALDLSISNPDHPVEIVDMKVTGFPLTDRPIRTVEWRSNEGVPIKLQGNRNLSLTAQIEFWNDFSGTMPPLSVMLIDQYNAKHFAVLHGVTLPDLSSDGS